MKPIFFGYYTKGTPYQDEAVALKESANALGLSWAMVPIDSLGSWQANTSFKPQVIRGVMKANPGRPLVYVDVDARIVKRPSLLLDGDLEGVDIAAAKCVGGTVLLSGTIWIGNGPGSATVVDRWCELCKEYPEHIPPRVHPRFPRGAEAWDQRLLELAIMQTPTAVFRELPEGYTHTEFAPADVEPVIAHHLASRKHRETLKRDDDMGMAEAFGRDPVFEASMRRLAQEHGIRTVIETGTWRGYTARKLAGFVPQVHTIEIDPKTASMARETLAGLGNVTIHEGSSPELMPAIMKTSERPILYFLDAHWHAKWPLFDELELIAGDAAPCVIVIHDCEVPGRDFGFDTYNGRKLDLYLVLPWLTRLQFPWRYSYNTEAAGHRRGVLFIEPTK